MSDLIRIYLAPLLYLIVEYSLGPVHIWHLLDILTQQTDAQYSKDKNTLDLDA